MWNSAERYLHYDPLPGAAAVGPIIGSGSIGGKAKGLVFAHEALSAVARQTFPGGFAPDDIAAVIEIPPVYVIADGVFAEFLAINHLPPPGIEPLDEETKNRFQDAQFPAWLDPVLARIVTEMDFPLAVRSSSRLEDSPHASFAGKYLTVFLSNTGPVEARVRALAEAIRRVYFSTYGLDATEYRRRHNLDGDSMAVIVQKLAGRARGRYFYPELAGVGHSHNYRRWTERIAVEDGVMRVVFGLGTRSTGRGYARVICPAHPRLRPEGQDPAAVARYAQEIVDVLDLETGATLSVNINDEPALAFGTSGGPGYLQIYDAGRRELRSARGDPVLSPREKYVFTFPALERSARMVIDATSYLFRLLEAKMEVPVDLEFAAEPADDRYYLIQARPLWSWEEYRPVHVPAGEKGVILRGNRMLTNGERTARWLVVVDPAAYASTADKHSVARAVGNLNRKLAGERYILVGPGRWGSTSPGLGVPVRYGEISNCGVLVELGTVAGDFTPEFSWGTHFFADLEQDGILYMPVIDGAPDNLVDWQYFSAGAGIIATSGHPAVRVFQGEFAVYMDARRPEGVVIDRGSHPV